MKKLLFLAAAVFAGSAMAQNVSYSITGTADSKFEGKSLYLLNNGVCIDTLEVKDLKFSASGALDAPAMCELQYGPRGKEIVILDGTPVTVELGNRAVAIKGGCNDKLTAFIERMNVKANEIRATLNDMQETNPAGVQEYYNKATKELDDMMTTEWSSNKDNIYGATVFVNGAMGNYNDLASFDAAVAQIKYAAGMPAVKRHREGLVAVEATKAGKMFVDFAGKNIDGTPAKLSDYVGKGKYVLVDFWASWCGPCRGEIPNLVELQNKYGAGNFTVLGVNVWDKKDAFEKALTDEGINYPQIYASDSQDATTLYGIKGIPQIILFAPDGTIVQRDLRGEQMKSLIDEKMAK